MSIWRRITHKRDWDGLHAFYANAMMRSLVFALIGIFTPLFVYRKGLEIWGGWEAGLLSVAGFYLVTRLTVLLTAVPVARMIERIGFRRSVLVSVVWLGLYLICLKLSGKIDALVFLAPVLSGISIPWYWIARNSALTQDESRRKVGKQMGLMLTFEQIATILGPFAAGVIVERFGYGNLFLLALLMLLVSAILVFFMNGHTHQNGASWRGFYYYIRDRRYFHQAVGAASKSIDEYSLGVVWPLSIYLLGWHASSLGGLFSMVSIVAVAVRMLGGAWFDRLHKKRDYKDEILYAAASAGTSLAWLLRLFVRSVGQIFSLDLLASVVGTLHGSMYVDYEHLGGIRMGGIAYWVYTEIIYSAAAILLMIVMIVGIAFGVWKEAIFIFTSLWVLLGVVQARESNLI